MNAQEKFKLGFADTLVKYLEDTKKQIEADGMIATLEEAIERARNYKDALTVDLEAGTVDGLSGADEKGVIEALKEEAEESVDVAETLDEEFIPRFPNHPDDPIQNNYFN